MNLVTKCPHCHTAFRVTNDQLALYDGTVRCGICQQVFNGKDHLLKTDDSDDSVLQKTESLITTPPVQKESDQGNSLFSDEDDLSISLSDDDINAFPEREALFEALEAELSTISLELEQVTGELFEDEKISKEIAEDNQISREINKNTPSRDPISHKAPVKITSRFTDLSLYPNLSEPAKNMVYSIAPHLDDVANISPRASVEVIEPNQPEPEPAPSPLAANSYLEIDSLKEKEDNSPPVKEPQFVKPAKKNKWRTFFSRLILILITIALLGTLAIQCLYIFSDRMAVWWPPAEPVITKACNTLACPRRLETRISALTIESSELQAITELKNKYAMSLLIRNSSSSYQSWPHIELTLIDQEKKPVIRRIFTPANYLPDAESIIKGIPPYTEKSVEMYLEIKIEPNADYRIYLFYP